ncbi:hypothetical protein ZIOFF_027773 [Zingiber officinale]|uniref:BHLH domain-containing protein n=1 Tax=Zingiber officinale TaxID=94328 RepID=A0A8J5GR05_ZINOF|nr:hypothetical protein ZIOFF_027773 [Zingiber officinale]
MDNVTHNFWDRHHHPAEIMSMGKDQATTALWDHDLLFQHPYHHQLSHGYVETERYDEGGGEEKELGEEDEEEELGAMKEMMYRVAAMQPVDIDPAAVAKPRRRNVRISDDPQSVAARHRRERISERIRILQRLVPGGTKMDTASMLDEAIRYTVGGRSTDVKTGVLAATIEVRKREEVERRNYRLFERLRKHKNFKKKKKKGLE